MTSGALPDRLLLAASRVDVYRGRRRVLSGVEFEARRGDVVHIVGRNGSGKTSLLRVLSGVAAARAGVVRRRARAAFVPEQIALAPGLRCWEWLDAMRQLRGEDRCEWAPALEASGVATAVLDARAGAISKGTLQRLALIEALAAPAGLMLFDEPFSGLDADGRAWLAGAIRARAADGAAVVLTDHALVDDRGLSPTATIQLADGHAHALTAGAVAARRSATVVVTAVDRNGERGRHEVFEDAIDDLLRELLAAGWHIEAVR
jgi:ABC-type multidrug transport system ATPase subunit